LSHFNLLVDIRQRRLMDGNTNQKISGQIANISVLQLSCLNSNVAASYHDLLSDFPSLTRSSIERQAAWNIACHHHPRSTSNHQGSSSRSRKTQRNQARIRIHVTAKAMPPIQKLLGQPVTSGLKEKRRLEPMWRLSQIKRDNTTKLLPDIIPTGLRTIPARNNNINNNRPHSCVSTNTR